MFHTFLRVLANHLHQQNKELIVVLSPIRTEEDKQYMNPTIFNYLSSFVDRFSLMTYDYSSQKM